MLRYCQIIMTKITIILSLDIKYFMHDLICEVKITGRPTGTRICDLCHKV